MFIFLTLSYNLAVGIIFKIHVCLSLTRNKKVYKIRLCFKIAVFFPFFLKSIFAEVDMQSYFFIDIKLNNITREESF